MSSSEIDSLPNQQGKIKNSLNQMEGQGLGTVEKKIETMANSLFASFFPSPNKKTKHPARSELRSRRASLSACTRQLQPCFITKVRLPGSMPILARGPLEKSGKDS